MQSDNGQFNAGGASNQAEHPVIAPWEPNALGIYYARHVACQTQAGHAQQAYPAVALVPLRRQPPEPAGLGAQQFQAVPVILPQAQYVALYQPPAQMPGQMQIDPEAEMINNLLQHI